MSVVAEILGKIPEIDRSQGFRQLSLAISQYYGGIISDEESHPGQAGEVLHAAKLAVTIQAIIPSDGKVSSEAFFAAAGSLPQSLFGADINKGRIAQALAIVAQNLGDQFTPIPINPAIESFKRKIDFSFPEKWGESVIIHPAELTITFGAKDNFDLHIEFSGSQQLVKMLTGFNEECKSFAPGDTRLYGLLRAAGLPEIIELTPFFPYEKSPLALDSRIVGLGQQRNLADFILKQSVFSFETSAQPRSLRNTVKFLISQPTLFMRNLLDKDQHLVTRRFLIRPKLESHAFENVRGMQRLVWLLRTSAAHGKKELDSNPAKEFTCMKIIKHSRASYYLSAPGELLLSYKAYGLQLAR